MQRSYQRTRLGNGRSIFSDLIFVPVGKKTAYIGMNADGTIRVPSDRLLVDGSPSEEAGLVKYLAAKYIK